VQDLGADQDPEQQLEQDARDAPSAQCLGAEGATATTAAITNRETAVPYGIGTAYERACATSGTGRGTHGVPRLGPCPTSMPRSRCRSRWRVSRPTSASWAPHALDPPRPQLALLPRLRHRRSPCRRARAGRGTRPDGTLVVRPTRPNCPTRPSGSTRRAGGVVADHPRVDARLRPAAHAHPRHRAIPEVVRHLPGALRSAHPAYSFCAVGPHAVTITTGHASRTVGRRVPLARLYDLDADILLRASDTPTTPRCTWPSSGAGPDTRHPGGAGARRRTPSVGRVPGDR